MDVSADQPAGADETPESAARLKGLRRDFEQILDKLQATRAFGKGVHQTRLFAIAMKLLKQPGGAAVLYDLAPRFDAAGVFAGGDWDYPHILQPALVRSALLGEGLNTPVECLSELRMLSIAQGLHTHDELTPEAARGFLEEVLARNLDLLFPAATEAARVRTGENAERIQRLFAFLSEQLGSFGILEALIAEAERVLLQRPIMIERVKALLYAAEQSLALQEYAGEGEAVQQTREFIAALRGPTPLCQTHPLGEDYKLALAGLDAEAFSAEAQAFGESMKATGLVSAPHTHFLRFVASNLEGEQRVDLIADALSLERVGRTSLAEHEALITELIERAVTPGTSRCVYGLSRMLERGILFFQPVAPGLRRLMVLPIHEEVAQQLQSAAGYADQPQAASTLLLAGTLSVLGQPRGVDQGHNPTCQAARAISLWSQNDEGFLLELIARAARDGDLVMHFEGEAIRSSELTFGLARTLHTELDPVSLILTPHLDKIYMEMSRRTIGRGEDGHKWVNPEFHGWWVFRSFASVVDEETEAIKDFDGFVRRFYAAYHPEYNGGRDLVYAQPCGVVSTDTKGGFVGWHAVSIQRIALDPEGVWRVYFYNPNRDKGQNWGQGIVTSTCDAGEWEGESSLPFEQFAMRLYVFHYKRRELGDPAAVPAETVADIRAAVAESWAAEHAWLEEE